MDAPRQPKKWLSTVTYRSSVYGNLDVDFAHDTNAELDTLVDNGPGRSVVVTIVTRPDPAGIPLGDTLEALLARLEIIDDLKTCAIEGSQRELRRSPGSTRKLAGDHANAQFRTDSRLPSREPDPGACPV